MADEASCGIALEVTAIRPAGWKKEGPKRQWENEDLGRAGTVAIFKKTPPFWKSEPDFWPGFSQLC